jgi:hypothetical protein
MINDFLKEIIFLINALLYLFESIGRSTCPGKQETDRLSASVNPACHFCQNKPFGLLYTQCPVSGYLQQGFPPTGCPFRRTLYFYVL